MIRFIIVDDDKEQIAHIEKLLKEVVEDEMEIKSFTKFNKELKAEIQDVCSKKVYVLDIELNDKIDGINIAKLIRDVDWESEIIFMTNHDRMFDTVHRNIFNVFRFIEKFHNFDSRFKHDIKKIISNNFDNKMFKYKANNASLSLYYKTILYIYRETEERKLVIVTDKNKFKVSLCVKEIIPMLDDRFKQCHRSCIVNVMRIQEMNFKDGYFILDNSEQVYMLSKKYRKELEND